MQRWSPGDAVVWRTGHDGQVWSAHPMTVVRDTPELVVLCIRPGTVIMRRSATRGGPRGRNLLTWDGSHDEPWERWRPDPSWPLPALPAGWDMP